MAGDGVARAVKFRGHMTRLACRPYIARLARIQNLETISDGAARSCTRGALGSEGGVQQRAMTCQLAGQGNVKPRCAPWRALPASLFAFRSETAAHRHGREFAQSGPCAACETGMVLVYNTGVTAARDVSDWSAGELHLEGYTSRQHDIERQRTSYAGSPEERHVSPFKMRLKPTSVKKQLNSSYSATKPASRARDVGRGGERREQRRKRGGSEAALRRRRADNATAMATAASDGGTFSWRRRLARLQMHWVN
ncbi:hypothetical protein DFH06DRAFT_1119344 [Mycena polygramma]|nr:hypothetical protein DFH06DRAFT_1119344 [Mycena polygramma]